MTGNSIHTIESLRRGIPPQKGVEEYSVGMDKLINGIKKFHFPNISEVGKIRFMSGSWGSGKTHFFRLLREIAFKQNILVSNVELSIDSAPFNKFEQVFYSIIRNISTPSSYENLENSSLIPLGNLIEEPLKTLGEGLINSLTITYEHFTEITEKLMINRGIDIDFKKMVKQYWESFLPENADPTLVETKREEILQWFSGEGTISKYRKNYNVNKMVSRQYAKIMLHSLAEFVKLAGYKGLIVLFDEAEQSYSIMRRNALKDAHNNLLSLINNIELNKGIFMIYATTPDFFSDPKHGIIIYGALAGRIGKLEDKQPSALDTVWNLDAISPKFEDYKEAALKLRKIYCEAYTEAESEISDDSQIIQFIEELYNTHPKLSAVKFWRVMMTSLIRKFDLQFDGEDKPTHDLYNDIMDRLRED